MTEPSSNPTGIDDRLVAYLEAQDRYHLAEVGRRWDAMTLREKRLVREAAVMGYVQGVRSVPGSHKEPIPPDASIVTRVIDACLGMSDLYPFMSKLGRRRRA